VILPPAGTDAGVAVIDTFMAGSCCAGETPAIALHNSATAQTLTRAFILPSWGVAQLQRKTRCLSGMESKDLSTVGRVSAVSERLAAAGCVFPDDEAEVLVGSARDADDLERSIRRREAGEPLAWITGNAAFCGATVHVEPGVYVPRAQTEELARRAAAALLVSATRRAADLCTGSGAVATHMLASVPDASVVGVDIDSAAAACAHHNGVPSVVGDLGAPLRPGWFDVVTAVAPYVPTGEVDLLPSEARSFEPRKALDGGSDGLDVVRGVVAAAGRLLRAQGWLFTEIGGAQDVALTQLLEASGFDAVTVWFDEDGDLRGIAAQSLGSM
jgi:release factor glutamine methyltransferase